MSSLDALTDQEKQALTQLQAITNGADVDTQISLLQSVDWDVQVSLFIHCCHSFLTRNCYENSQAALSAIYGDDRPPAPSPPRNTLEPMEIDDSLVFDAQPPRRAAYPFPMRLGLGRGGVLSILTSPITLTFNLLASLFHFVFRVLRIPFPRFNTRTISFNRTARRGSYSDDPSVVAERWVRELEEETGTVSISKAALIEAQEYNEPGPSNRPVRRHPTKTKTLPDFFLGGYDAALRVAQRELRVLCVIITSEEHDDVPEFRKQVLTDPEFVKTITDNHILVWGGDVRERDGYQGIPDLVLYQLS